MHLTNIFVCLVLFSTKSSCFQVYRTYDLHMNTKGLQSSPDDKTFRTTSIIKCIGTCFLDPDCCTATYNPELRLCRWHSHCCPDTEEAEQGDTLITTSEGALPGALSVSSPGRGWLRFGSSCFHFSHEKLNWFTAQSSCIAHNASLAEPVSKEVADYLINTAVSLQGNVGKVPYYLGARNEEAEGTWVWVSSGRAMNYSAWGPGEPNVHQSGNCLTMFHTLQWMWSDDYCGDKLYFVCERMMRNTNRTSV